MTLEEFLFKWEAVDKALSDIFKKDLMDLISTERNRCAEVVIHHPSSMFSTEISSMNGNIEAIKELVDRRDKEISIAILSLK